MDSLRLGIVIYQNHKFLNHNMYNGLERLFHILGCDANKMLAGGYLKLANGEANCAVCKADDSGATALSSSASCKELYGTHSIGLYGKIRSWKSVAILQMLEKQMGPEFFRKILQKVISRARDTIPVRSLSTKEFRHFATKVGNLERPFVKEFFPRWVCSCGCPVLRMGFSYNKRKNMVELAVLRECTAAPDANASFLNPDSENREGDIGWPGMMSIRVYELDGMYDHPVLPLAGEMWQLLEIQCHSKLAARRFQKPRKSSKPDGLDENGDVPASDMRSRYTVTFVGCVTSFLMDTAHVSITVFISSPFSLESPLSWIRADPEMEYLAEIHFNQPIQMWINQLEKDEDVVAQAQAIAALKALPQLSFSVTNAMNNFLSDTKAFWRVRIETAFALANTASEAIPHAVAKVRAADKKSPREAVEFILQLLKYNDNNGNPYSDVFWLAALVQSVGELEFGQQNHVFELIKPFRDFKTIWQIRIEATRALLDLEFHCKGMDAALGHPYLVAGQAKLGAHAMRLCQIQDGSDSKDDIKSTTLLALIRLLDGHIGFNNVILRHHLALTLYGVPRDRTLCIGDSETCSDPRNIFAGLVAETKGNIFAGLVAETKPLEPHMEIPNLAQDNFAFPEAIKEADIISDRDQHKMEVAIPEGPNNPDTISNNHEQKRDLEIPEASKEPAVPEASKEADTISNSHERRLPVVKIRVKHSAASSRAEETDNQNVERSQGGRHETDRRASSSVSVDAPQRISTEAVSISYQNLEEVNSCLDHGSRMSASIGSAKIASDGDNFGKELQCTAESSKVSMHPQPDDPSSPSVMQDNHVDTDAQRFASLQTLSVGRIDLDGGSSGIVASSFRGKEKEKKKKKGKEKKRKQEDHKGHHDYPEYLERKRLKKEKKRKEKEMAKLLSDGAKATSVELPGKNEKHTVKLATVLLKPNEPSGSKAVTTNIETKPEPSEGTSSAPKFRIKIKNRTLNN
ncbi:unnamed protein product [Dovyalis caffra]|uniref:Transcription initiation factor TFIID subunit 2 n=1 Tax=Dovyalis caffra TaxID=77055 RepID=A0AAV1SFG7_9ROSI|nr:unnamed protein product [Dovyalis caffra]